MDSSFQLCVCQKYQDRLGEGRALGNLGCVYADMQEWAQAKLFFEAALDFFRDAGDKMLEEMTLQRIDMATKVLTLGLMRERLAKELSLVGLAELLELRELLGIN